MTSPATSAIRKLDTNLGPGSPQALAQWQAALAPMYEVALPPGDTADNFAVTGTTYMLPHAFAVQVSSVALILRRPPALIARSPIDNVEFFLCREGSVAADYDGASVTIEAGDLAFVDYRKPVTSHASAFASVALSLTRDKVPSLFRSGEMHGVVLRANQPVTRLLAHALDGLLATIEHLSVAQAEAAIAGFLLLAKQAWIDASTAAAAENTLVLDRAVALLAANVSHPAMTPDKLAERVGVSRTSLYRLFAPYGGVASYRLKLRLDASLKALLDRSSKSVNISNIALQHGFTSHTSFSRAFRARFGRTPGDIARAMQSRPAGQSYTSWLKLQAEHPNHESINAWLGSIDE
jgi:AraC-like DNA-binding protein